MSQQVKEDLLWLAYTPVALAIMAALPLMALTAEIYQYYKRKQS